MEPFRSYGNLLQFDGTNQLQRVLPALGAAYVVPDERTLSDLLTYALRLAAEIRFYDLTGQSTGDWRALLEPLLDGATGRVLGDGALEERLQARTDWPAHLVLFVTFLKLFRHLQDDLNELPRRHLTYYYETALGLARRSGAADQVHVMFELARNAADTLLPAGSLVDAGKDDQGRVLAYRTHSDLVVSNASIVDIRRTVTETDRRGNRRFFAADALAESETQSWHPFGRKQLELDATQRTMTEPALGFALTSPVLRLAEGVRTVKVKMTLRVGEGVEVPGPQAIGYMLDLALTGAEGWLSPDSVSAELLNTAGVLSLLVQLSVAEAAPAIIPFDTSLHGSGPDSAWPMLRCLIKGDTGIYETLDGLLVESALIEVSAYGVRDLIVQNDDGPLSASNPMALFGNQPKIGSTFYVGSAEVLSKKLSYLAFNLEWQSPPDDLYEHYRAYFDHADVGLTEDFRSYFLADVDLLYDRSWDHHLLVNQFLFAVDVTQSQRIAANSSAFISAFGPGSYEALPHLRVVNPYSTDTKHGFLRLTLRGPTRRNLEQYASTIPFEAFGHQAFSRRYATQAIELAKWTSGPKPALPELPYVPLLAGLSLDYHASAQFTVGDAHAAERLYLLGPFGHSEIDDKAPAALVPRIKGAGALYLGIDQLQVPSTLSLLFQIETGTSRSTDVLKPGETHWSYLRRDGWRTLPPTGVLNDSTSGFQKPGLVVLSLPKDAATQHTAMPSGLVWLRAHIERDPESAARTIAVHTSAVLAAFAEAPQEFSKHAQHLEKGLDAQTITRLQQRNPAIKRAIQPYPSFDGSASENDAGYFRRCSERLRHRNRAVTVWDFERLVLEEFPGVFKVKCLPHGGADGRHQAGEMALVIVPDLRSVASSNPLEPRAGAVLMREVEAYLAANLATPFAKVHVIHPVYEVLRVSLRVAFKSGLDAGWYTAVLNEVLRRFLSPWAYAPQEDIVFGASIYKSEILAHLERLEFVDYVTDFDMYHSYDGPPREGIAQMTIGTDFFIRPDPHPAVAEMKVGEDFIVGRDVDVARTTRPHAILVSHAEHLISPIHAGDDRCTGVTRLGIGYMTVGLDFKLQPQYA